MKNTAVQVSTQSGGYIYLAAIGCPTLKVAVDSADMASGQMSGYIRQYGLGGSALKRNCGNIYANNGKLTAKVSYNGRVWDTEGNLIQDVAGCLPVPPERNRCQ
jgi:hypothetical protein